MVQIGNLNIQGKVSLAPMAGITDRSFREICKKYGAALVETEMVSAKGILYSEVVFRRNHNLLKY